MLLVDHAIFEEKIWLIFVVPISALFFPTFLIIAIMDGPYQFLNRREEIKAQYFSVELEKKCIEYEKALKEYDHYLDQINKNYWIQMTGLEFEKEVASLFRGNGYNATLTPATADGGVDIILIRGDERIAVQCKHHVNPVGPNDVRALQGVVASQNYSKGIFVSLNGYTATVRQEVRSGNVQIELLELKDILQMAKEDRKPSIKKPSENRNLSYQPAPFKQSKSAQESQISKSREFNRKITVQLGDEVKIRYLEDGEVMTIKLVPCDPDFSKHEYSVESPVGKAIFGRKIHDIAEIYINDKIIRVEILELA